MRQSKWGKHPYANFISAHFVKYLDSMLMDFHETSITGILLMRWSQWGVQPNANFKTAHFAKYLSSMSMDFHETSIPRIPLMKWSNWGLTTYANFKTAQFVKYFSSMLMDFHETSYNRDSVDEMITMRCTTPMPTSKVHILLNIPAPCWWIFQRLL